MKETISDIPYLYRYLKSSDIKDSIPWDQICGGVNIDRSRLDELVAVEAFNLREETGERDVSFFWSSKSDDVSRILEVLDELKRRGKSFSARAGMLKVDAVEAHNSINDPDELIEFRFNDRKDFGCLHHGLYFITEDPMERLEVINSIIELSDFFAIRKNRKLDRSLMAAIDGGSSFVCIAEDIAI